MSTARVFRVVRRLGRHAGLVTWVGAAAMFVSPGSVMAHAEHGHPAAIHEGSCEQLGRLAYRLNGVGGSVDVDNAPVATPTAVNPDTAYQMLLSETIIDAPLADLVAGDHAVMVYESDEEMSAIACGNVGGAMLGDTLVTGLAELGVPGHNGLAIFTADGDETMVEVVIGHGLAPVSASGAAQNPDHDEATETTDEEHAHDDEAAPATPAS